MRAKREPKQLTPAFGYIRVSGLGQADGDGPVRQKQAIERFAAREGYEIKGWYSDIGVTGKSDWEDREQFAAMLEALNGTRTILVEKLDRLARAVLVQELILRDLKKRDVRLLSAAGDDSEDEQPERVMFRQMLGVFAEYERASIVLKLRAARKRKKLATGRCEGRKPFGFKPAEQETIQRITTMRAGGMHIEAIAAALNESGTPTRMAGGRWHPTMVSRILHRASKSAV